MSKLRPSLAGGLAVHRSSGVVGRQRLGRAAAAQLGRQVQLQQGVVQVRLGAPGAVQDELAQQHQRQRPARGIGSEQV